jgi:coenzyme F420-reducing hydrogenase gamma subunit
MFDVAKPTLAVWKLASCDGCQLQLLHGDDVLTLAERFSVAFFPELTPRRQEGPWDVALVEGSVSTPADQEKIRDIRRSSRLLVAMGTCATAGGVQALRGREDLRSVVYPRPSALDVLQSSDPLSAHVQVDVDIPGCPVDQAQLYHALAQLAAGRRPRPVSHSVCLDCKRAGVGCLAVTRGELCLGPVTRGGCGAVCPRQGRGCDGCFGLAPGARPERLWALRGARRADAARRLAVFQPPRLGKEAER